MAAKQVREMLPMYLKEMSKASISRHYTVVTFTFSKESNMLPMSMLISGCLLNQLEALILLENSPWITIRVWKKDNREAQLTTWISSHIWMVTEESFITNLTMHLWDQKTALSSRFMKEDSNKLSLMATAEFSPPRVIHPRPPARLDTTRKTNPTVNIKNSPSMANALPKESWKVLRWPKTAESTHSKLDLSRPPRTLLPQLVPLPLEWNKVGVSTIMHINKEHEYMP